MRSQLQPAPAVPHESKRQGALVQEDDFLVEGMKELDEQTREKNREFSRRIVRGPLPSGCGAAAALTALVPPQSDLIARRKRTAERLQEEAGERTEEIARIRVRACPSWPPPPDARHLTHLPGQADFEESVKRTVAQLTAEIDEEFDRIEQSSYEPMVAQCVAGGGEAAAALAA